MMPRAIEKVCSLAVNTNAPPQNKCPVKWGSTKSKNTFGLRDVLGWNILITWLALVTGLANGDDSTESSCTAAQCRAECLRTLVRLK